MKGPLVISGSSEPTVNSKLILIKKNSFVCLMKRTSDRFLLMYVCITDFRYREELGEMISVLHWTT